MTKLIERIDEVFKKIEVKEPFSTSHKFFIIQPTPAQLAGIIKRLEEIYTNEELDKMNEEELKKSVKRVWELVRWIHYE